jgi:hypothetical protein
MNLTEKLSKLHGEYSLYSKKELDSEDKNNIINSLKDTKELVYLHDFYKNYSSFMDDFEKEDIKRDLPFIGKSVIEKEKAKFLFYFEGSLSKEKKLSITVLANLWGIKDSKLIEKFCWKDNNDKKENPHKWWTLSNFNKINNQLGIEMKIANNSYITDAKRLISDIENHKLIHEEIKMLEPKLVICIGDVARNIVGMKYYKNTKFHHVGFPSNRHSISLKSENKKAYDELKKILQDF